MAVMISTSKAENLKQARESHVAAESGLTWDRFCAHHFGLSRAQADRFILRLETFGPSYFQLAEIAGVTDSAFRRLGLAGHLVDGCFQFDGQSLEIAPQNAPEIRAAIQSLREAAAKSKKSRAPSAPLPTPEPRLEDHSSGASLTKNEVQAVIDDWHDAAAARDYGRCRSHFTPRALFFGPGTDDRFTPDEFRICPQDFEFGPRQISLSPDGHIAWFCETLRSAPCFYRLTGVLIRLESVWKIALLNLCVTSGTADSEPRT